MTKLLVGQNYISVEFFELWRKSCPMNNSDWEKLDITKSSPIRCPMTEKIFLSLKSFYNHLPRNFQEKDYEE